jgi:dehydrogenase/reductase SDR family protein 7
MTTINKVIWITGASSGIGEALAHALVAKNSRLIISARNEAALQALKANYPAAQIEVLPFDLLDFENAPAVVEKAISFYGKVDVLVNNGGISQRSLIADTDFAVDKKIMDVDYFGTIVLTKALLPHFIQNQSGHYVTVTSLMGKFGSPYRSGYCAAKHALHGYFDVLRMEHEKDGIDVTLVCPGFVQTNVAINALTADGSPQVKNSKTTENGMTLSEFIPIMIRAIEQKRFEVYIGKKEVIGIYLKRFFPKWLHRVVIQSEVQ